MEWFSQNWVWVLFAAAMIAMHMFGHGGHGGHGGYGGRTRGGDSDPKPTGKEDGQRPPKQEPGHHH
jgi:hypothetical protein